MSVTPMVSGRHAAGAQPMKPRAVLTMDEGGSTYNIRVECENNPDFWLNIHIDELPQDPEDDGLDEGEENDA